MLHTLEEKVDPKHAALVVVDVQNDYCHREGVVAKRGHDMSSLQAMVPPLQRFIDEARQAGVKVIFVRTLQNEATMSEVWIEQRLDRPQEGRFPCLEGTWGAELYQLQPQPGDTIVTKHRYSAFINTDLETILRSNGLRSLIMTGVATNVCVESTARHGFMLDYYIVFLSDLTATTSQEEHEATLRNIQGHFGTIATAAAVQQAWARLKVGLARGGS